MSRFIYGKDSTLLNTDHIVSIVPTHDGAGCVAMLTDGTSHRLSLDSDEIGHLCDTIIPAGPGWRVLEIHSGNYSDTKEPWHSESPVLAFGVSQKSFVAIRVYTTTDVYHEFSDAIWCLLNQEGDVEVSHAILASTRHEFITRGIEQQKKEDERQEQRRAAKQAAAASKSSEDAAE